MTNIPITIQTALQADIIIKGSKLREMLEGATSQEFLNFVAQHCSIVIPGTGLTEEDLPAAIAAAGVTDATQLQKIAGAYLKDGINCSVEYDIHRLQDDFHQHVAEYVTDWKENRLVVAEKARQLEIFNQSGRDRKMSKI